ncbi:MAG: TonB-dependent receptor, partial [Alphaproteobacteria bacterium]
GCAFDFGGYLNVEKVRSKGVELEARARLDKDLLLRAHWTYTDARNDLTGERLKDVPWYQGAIGLDWRFLERASAGATLRFRGEAESGFGSGQRVNDFVTLDLRAAYEITDAISIYGRIVNLFDAEYEEIFGIGTPGISGYAGIRVRW